MRLSLRNTVGTAIVCLLVAEYDICAASLDVRVIDKDNRPVADVVVYVDGPARRPAPLSAQNSAIMDQIDKRFVPHILVIQSGTEVEFPNSDPVAHHVYSFSKPNSFELPLYKGEVHSPVRFSHSGLVTVGCNIHDQMLGYILVVDNEAYASTDSAGRVRLTVEASPKVIVRIWSPRIRDRAESLVQEISLLERDNVALEFALRKNLSAPHGEHSQSMSWKDY